MSALWGRKDERTLPEEPMSQASQTHQKIIKVTAAGFSRGEHVARTGLRLLVLSTDAPHPPTNGLRMRISSMLAVLRSEGHQLVLLGAGSSGYPVPECEAAEFVPLRPAPLSSLRGCSGRARALLGRRSFSIERWRDPRWSERISHWLRRGGFDAIWCETPYPAINLPWPPPLPLLVNTHNLEYRIWQRYRATERSPWRRAYAALEERALRQWELQVYRQAALVWTCSAQEAELLRRQLSGRVSVAVAPNVLPMSGEAIAGELPARILFTGGLDWFPNRDAVEFFGVRIWPRIRQAVPDAEWIIAGRSGPRRWQQRWENLAGVRFTGTQASLEPWLRSAAVVVVPLRIGAGTRFKILEAAAWSRAIVSTTLGAEGLEFSSGRELELADTAEVFAAQVIALLRDPARRHALGNAARKKYEASYTLRQLRCAVAAGLAAWQAKDGRRQPRRVPDLPPLVVAGAAAAAPRAVTQFAAASQLAAAAIAGGNAELIAQTSGSPGAAP